MELILELNHVLKRFADFTLNGISFSLKPGYIMGLIGVNGSGKTTTIKLIMNLLQLDGGEIKLFGLDSRKHELKVKQKIGFVYDENIFYDDLTVEEMTRVIAPFYENWNWDSYGKYRNEFGLPGDQKIKTFSRGMKMKYALTIALSHEAKLLLLDEPTSGLDPVIRREFLDILSEVIQDEECSVLFSTHITSDLDRIADYITLIDNGNLVFSQSKEELLEKYSLIKGERSLLETEIRPYLLGVRTNQFGFEALVTEQTHIQSLVEGRAVFERPSLEDIMVFNLRGRGR